MSASWYEELMRRPEHKIMEGMTQEEWDACLVRIGAGREYPKWEDHRVAVMKDQACGGTT